MQKLRMASTEQVLAGRIIIPEHSPAARATLGIQNPMVQGRSTKTIPKIQWITLSIDNSLSTVADRSKPRAPSRSPGVQMLVSRCVGQHILLDVHSAVLALVVWQSTTNLSPGADRSKPRASLCRPRSRAARPCGELSLSLSLSLSP